MVNSTASAIMSAMFGKIETLSGWFELVEMVGHRQSIGHKLIDEDQAKQ